MSNRTPKVDAYVARQLRKEPEKRNHEKLERLATLLTIKRDGKLTTAQRRAGQKVPKEYTESDRMTLRALQAKGYGWPTDGCLFEELREVTVNVV